MDEWEFTVMLTRVKMCVRMRSGIYREHTYQKWFHTLRRAKFSSVKPTSTTTSTTQTRSFTWAITSSFDKWNSESPFAPLTILQVKYVSETCKGSCEIDHVLSNPMTDLSSLPPITPISNSFCVLTSNSLEISSIATLSFCISFQRGVGNRVRNGKVRAKRTTPLLRAEERGDALNVSKTSVTLACLPSSAPKL
jgi:hypothetical protein